ncbi:transposase [Streptomyces sp. NBC_00233]|uniref:IS110 family transposase n=1 Tax=Streptomyces sp. NBC_00233 TaxID=2975686 RepID=UPI002252CCE4|nr:transposase [Streptomyces sp. NBC_00233]MCX5233036.1 IS110 family transposase [Streptomyces sp. NBC_00233]
MTGLAVHRAQAGYRSHAKTDAKDAFVIADQTSDAFWSQAATASLMGVVGKAVASL